MQDINIQNTPAHSLSKYRNHLEFNGYKIEEQEDDRIFGLHPRKPNLILRKIGNRGVLVSTLCYVKKNINRINILEFTNVLNTELFFMKAYLDDERLIIETFFEGDYDRTNFSILLENIDFDMRTFLEHKLTETYIQ